MFDMVALPSIYKIKKLKLTLIYTHYILSKLKSCELLKLPHQSSDIVEPKF